jgi:hypothetical protein
MSQSGNHVLHGPTASPEYASASWESGDGDNIPEITLDSTIPGKFKTSLTNVLSKHCAELKTQSDEIVHPLISVSRKKLKELVSKHNNEVFSFMSRPDKTPHMIGIAETIFRRYGHEVPSIKGNTANTVLRDFNLDASMNSVVSEFDDNLKRIGGCGLEDFMKQMRWVFNQYKNIGEEILRQETVLHQKLDLLDKLNNRMPLITSLTNNEALPELIEAFSKYAESIYKTCQIDENYVDLVELYKKWNICRQIVSLQHNVKNDISEPQCAICLSEPVSYAIVPCGHTFCPNCSKKQNSNCYICRGIIRERIKLYFT